jgi:TonB-dependent SusC/RagA subfamily outer membrane receptor
VKITETPVSNITKGLRGFMPGVTVQDFGGRPGADGAQVRTAAPTLGNNGALIIVDGVVGEINNLDPLDIESVSVLKDAASAAIYGARAANGVVIIKTRGRAATPVDSSSRTTAMSQRRRCRTCPSAWTSAPNWRR